MKQISYDGYLVGTVIRKLRTERKLTKEELSDATGISVSTIKQYENGGRSLSIKNLFILIGYFDVDANTILQVDGLKEEKTIDEMLRKLELGQREYLERTFKFMLEQMENLAS